MFRIISWNVKGLRSPQKTYENSQTSKATKTRYCPSPGDAFTQRRFFKIAKTLGVSSVWLAGSRQTGWGVDSNNKHNNKAPGPDGYTGEFFLKRCENRCRQHFWIYLIAFFVVTQSLLQP